MSSSQAIHAVTEKILEVLNELVPSSVPLANEMDSQFNVFLYNLAKHPTWQNQDMPTLSKGQPGRPPLALNLYYIISACERNQKDAHGKLGRAMQLLHDRPILNDFPANSGIKNQVDPIRLTFQPMSLDEMSKLWSAFQTHYRPSAMYEVGVVLIESETASPTPLPVTRRGESHLGWDSTSQFPPTLTGVRFATSNQPGARITESVMLIGSNLRRRGSAQVSLQHVSWEEAKQVDITKSTSIEITFSFPSIDYPAGLYSVSVLYNEDGKLSSSSHISVPLLPEIVVPATGLIVSPATNSLSIPCRPAILPGQSVEVLIGSRPIARVEVSNAMDELIVSLSGRTFPAGEKEHRIARLRIDGVDSLVFDPNDLEAGFSKYHVKGID